MTRDSEFLLGFLKDVERFQGYRKYFFLRFSGDSEDYDGSQDSYQILFDSRDLGEKIPSQQMTRDSYSDSLLGNNSMTVL